MAIKNLMELSLEQMEKEKDRLIQEIEIYRHRDFDSLTLREWNRMKQLEAELEEFIGKVVYEPKRDADGNIIRKPYTIQRGAWKGITVTAIERDKDRIKEVIPGVIMLKTREAQNLLKASDLGKRFSDKTFDNFNYAHNKGAFEEARIYADTKDLFSKRKNVRLITGGIGTGKTHLASAITNRFCERGIKVLFATYEQHLQRLRDEMDETSLKTYLEKMKTISVLVLDDIGKEHKTDWTAKTLYSVINYRYEHMLPTIITTNLNDDEFFTWVGGDVASRLYETMFAIRTSGEDYRKVIGA